MIDVHKFDDLRASLAIDAVDDVASERVAVTIESLAGGLTVGEAVSVASSITAFPELVDTIANFEDKHIAERNSDV